MKLPIRIYKFGLHRGEESIVQGNDNAGMIYFSGCRLACKFCYTPESSQSDTGDIYSSEEFLSLILKLVHEGAKNVNLVTPSHLWNQIEDSLNRFKERDVNQTLPVVLKIDGSEPRALLRRMLKVADFLIPDFKIWNSTLAQNQGLPHYYGEQTLEGIRLAMQTLPLEYLPSSNNQGSRILRKGIVVRHLLMPHHESDSLQILQKLSQIRFNGVLNLMTHFIDPQSGRMITYPQTNLDPLLSFSRDQSFSLLVNGRRIDSI